MKHCVWLPSCSLCLASLACHECHWATLVDIGLSHLSILLNVSCFIAQGSSGERGDRSMVNPDVTHFISLPNPETVYLPKTLKTFQEHKLLLLLTMEFEK